VTPAVAVVRQACVWYTLHEYRHDPAHDSYGAEAAEALGLDPASVIKTLVAETGPSRLVVAMLPVARQLDFKALAEAIGAKRAGLADAAAAERATGYVVGGISPLGQRRRLAAVVDAAVLAREVVYVSGGRRGLEIALRPADLVQLTGASVASIGR